MVPARFIQGEFDLQEAEHLGMTIKAICTQGKQVAHYPLCSVAFRTQRRGGNLKTVIPFLLTVSCAFRDVEMHGAWLHSFPRSLTEDAMKAPAGLKICDLGSVGMGLGRPRIPFIIILTSLYLKSGFSETGSCVSSVCLSGSCIFYWPSKSKRGQRKGHSALCSRRWWFKLQLYWRRLKMLKILWNIGKNSSHHSL